MLRRSFQKVSSSTNLVEDQLREMLRAEHQIRASRPQPPMSARWHQPPASPPNCSHRFHRRYPNSARSPATGKPTSLEEPTHAELKKMLEKSERDRTMAAELGTLLLEEKKELQEKNEFLEESLASNIETIAQLERKLKQRSDLFHKLYNLEGMEDDDDGAGSGAEEKHMEHQLSRHNSMEQKIRQLEGENEELRTKANQLETLKAIVERREEQRITEYISQLRAANLRVAQLQVQLGEKARQCDGQAEEVKKLMREIGQRKNREKLLWEENGDLNFRLDEALTNHEQFAAEMKELQERHFELIVMLRETEDELKVYREKEVAVVPPRRSNSTDSLYDSLASELEGADSGCYSTPMFSARYGPHPHWSSLSNPTSVEQQQPCCSTNIEQQQNELSIDEPIVADRSLPLSASFDVPSRALIEAVRSTFEDRMLFRRRISPSHRLRKQMHTTMDEHDVEEDEQATPVVSNFKCFMDATEGIEQGKKDELQLCDASCSPIHFSTEEDEETANKSRIAEEENHGRDTTPKISRIISKEVVMPSTRIMSASSPPTHRSAASTSSTTNSGSSGDSASLYGGSPPKLGVPGIPGTNDLDRGLRRLGLRKAVTRMKNTEMGGNRNGGEHFTIDEDYRRFRANKGLQPVSGFYVSDLFGHANPHSSFGPSLSPSNQMKRISQQHNTGKIVPSLHHSFAKNNSSMLNKTWSASPGISLFAKAPTHGIVTSLFFAEKTLCRSSSGNALASSSNNNSSLFSQDLSNKQLIGRIEQRSINKCVCPSIHNSNNNSVELGIGNLLSSSPSSDTLSTTMSTNSSIPTGIVLRRFDQTQ